MKTEKISAGQWLGILLVSRLSTAVTFAPAFANSQDIWSTVLYGLTLAIWLLPSILLAKKTDRLDILQQAQRDRPMLGKILSVLLGLYCLYVLAINVLQFMYFVRESLSPDMPAAALCTALVAAAFWAAFYGVEAMARAVLPIAALLCGSIVGILLLLVPDMKAGYLVDALLTQASAGGWFTELVRSTELTVAGILLSHVSTKRIGKSAAGLVLLSVCFILLTRLTVTATLGDFANRQFYPYHMATTVVENGLFRRIDLVAVSIWVASIFVKMTLFAWAFSRCIKPICHPSIRRWVIPAGAIVVAACGILFSGQPHAAANGWLMGISLGGILLFAVVCPLGLLWRMRKEKRH